MYFRNFVNISPLEKGGSLHLNKFESLLTKDTLCQVLMKLAQWFWRRRFLKNINVFSQFGNYLLLEKGGSLHWTNLNPFHPRMLVPSFVEIDPGVLEKETKMWKVYDGTNDKVNGKILIRTAYLSLQLRWANKKSPPPKKKTYCKFFHLHKFLLQKL